MTEGSIRELQADIMRANAEHEAAKLRTRALREAQRDDDPFTWGAGPQGSRSALRRNYFQTQRPGDDSAPPTRGGYR